MQVINTVMEVILKSQYFRVRNADVLLNVCKDIGLAVNIGKTKRISRQVLIPMKKWKRLNTQDLY